MMTITKLLKVGATQDRSRPLGEAPTEPHRKAKREFWSGNDTANLIHYIVRAGDEMELIGDKETELMDTLKLTG